jgi:dihydrofolate reductase
MILIAALGRNRVIGSGNRMPWNVPEEYRQFLRIIEGQTLIMGRRSWEIFGPDVTSSRNVVVSRSVRELPGATVVDSVERAIEVAEGFGNTVFSAGGAKLYAQTLPLAEKMYLSYIEGEFSGDAYFPEFDESKWRVARREAHQAFEFVVYERR